MELIESYLSEKEQILWERKTYRDLKFDLVFLRYILLAIGFLLIVIIFPFIFLWYNLNIVISVFLILILLVSEIGLVAIQWIGHRWKRDYFNLIRDQLQDKYYYIKIYAITNKRVIIKNINELERIRGYLKTFTHLKDFLTQIEIKKDILSLKISDIEKVGFLRGIRRITFIPNSYPDDQLFYFDFFKFFDEFRKKKIKETLQQMQKVVEILRKLGLHVYE
jgi:hypothetical protein